MLRIMRLAAAMAMTVALISSTNSARAEHKYRFEGVCHDFHGEAHLVEALAHMDGAFFTRTTRDRVSQALAARRKTVAAYRDFCDAAAKRELLLAERHLVRYLSSRSPVELDSAHAAILASMEIERGIHAGSTQFGAQGFPVAPRFQSSTALAAPTVVARRAFRSYCYTGACHNYHGEAEMIRALELMDRALIADGAAERVRTIVAVKTALQGARNAVCQPEARRELLNAITDASRFAGTGDVRHLDESAAHIAAAMTIEQRAHTRPLTAPPRTTFEGGQFGLRFRF